MSLADCFGCSWVCVWPKLCNDGDIDAVACAPCFLLDAGCKDHCWSQECSGRFEAVGPWGGCVCWWNRLLHHSVAFTAATSTHITNLMLGSSQPNLESDLQAAPCKLAQVEKMSLYLWACENQTHFTHSVYSSLKKTNKSWLKLK